MTTIEAPKTTPKGLTRKRLAEIARTHRYALNTRPTPVDSWLNGYQQDVGDLLKEVARLRQAAERSRETA